MAERVDKPSSVREVYCPQCENSYADGEFCPVDGTRLVVFEHGSDDLGGQVIDGRFAIKERIGVGGMGAVYRAKQLSVGRDIAFKVIKKQLSSDPAAAKRFLREAKLASRLTHPNTAVVFDFGQTDDGLLYIAMELVDGEDLGQRIEQLSVLPAEHVIAIAVQLCDALEAAHGRGIVHRDLKPSNVILQPRTGDSDLVKVLDFGIARQMSTDATGETHADITHSNVVIGTPAYISPEGALALEVDGRSDLYSVGVMIYEMVSGRLPFEVTNANEYLVAHATYDPVPLESTVPPTLRAIVERLLNKDPGARFQTASELKRALALVEVPPPNAHPKLANTVKKAAAPARTLPPPQPVLDPRKRKRPHRWLAAGAATIVFVAAAALLAIGGGDDAPPSTAGDEASGVATEPAKHDDKEAKPSVRPLQTDSAAAAPPQQTKVILRANREARAVLDKAGRSYTCTTPCTLEVPAGGDATLEFRRRGFRTERRTIKIVGEELHERATLRRRAERKTDDRPF